MHVPIYNYSLVKKNVLPNLYDLISSILFWQAEAESLTLILFLFFLHQTCQHPYFLCFSCDIYVINVVFHEHFW